MATSFAPQLLRLFDELGEMLANGFVYTYAAGTDTPLVTYQDLEGDVENTNPVELDAGASATIRVTNGVAYKFIVKDADLNVIYTEDDIIVGQLDETTEDDYEVILTYCATPGAQGWMGGEEFRRSVSFGVDFDGSGGSVVTNPASDYVISVQKNGVEVGTITISSAGVFTFDTTGGATVSFVAGDTIDFYGPDAVGTAANFKATLIGSLA
jgi:hypothetical protein